MLKRIEEFKNMLKEHRLGFAMDEVMSGHHQFVYGHGPKGTHKFEFNITWGPKNIGPWLNPFGDGFMTQPLEGTVFVGGLCADVPCKGTFQMAYFSEGKIRYTFEFTANGKDYLFVGEKVNIRPWNLAVSHTTCFGTLTEKDTGKLISRSVTFFKLHTTPKFLASLRFA